MKKNKFILSIMIIVICILMVAILASCSEGKQINKLGLPAGEIQSYKANHVASLDGYTVGNIDNFGLATGFKNNEDNSVSYILYDFTSNVSFPSDYEYVKLSDGLYSSTNDSTGTTNFYGKNGLIKSTAANYVKNSADDISFDDGQRIYIDVNGKAVLEDDSVYNRITASTVKGFDSYGEYYYQIDDTDTNIITVANTKTNSINTYNANELFRTSSESYISATWTVGKKIFYQYVTKLPFDSEKYDFYMTETKYNIDTYSFDFESNKTDSYNKFDMLVNDVIVATNNYAILSGSKIENKTVLGYEIIQCYNDKCKVYVDLQEIMPGMVEISYQSGIIICYDFSENVKVFREDELIGEYSGNISSARSVGKYLYKNKSFYDYGMNKIYTLQENEEFINIYNDNLVTKITSENTEGGSETTVYIKDLTNNGKTFKTVSPDLCINNDVYFVQKAVSDAVQTYDVYSFGFNTPIISDLKINSIDTFHIENSTVVGSDKLLILYSCILNGEKNYYAATIQIPSVE